MNMSTVVVLGSGALALSLASGAGAANDSSSVDAGQLQQQMYDYRELRESTLHKEAEQSRQQREQARRRLERRLNSDEPGGGWSDRGSMRFGVGYESRMQGGAGSGSSFSGGGANNGRGGGR